MTSESDLLLWRRDLLAGGWTRGEVQRGRRRGDLEGVRRGVYLPPGVRARTTDPVGAHVLGAHAAAPEVADDVVFSHVTAAALLGLPIWRIPLNRLHLTRDRPGGGRLRPGSHVHAMAVPPGDAVRIDGLRVTSPARTVVDLARTERFEQALVVADAALHQDLLRRSARESGPGAASEAELAAALARATGRRGCPAARRVVAWADGRSESVGESRSRVAIARSRLPTPTLQWSPAGMPDVRTDFAWPEQGVVGEFDGRVKYGRLLRPGQDPAEVLWEEKRREDRLRATGLTVVRWVWGDLPSFSPVAARLRMSLGC